MPTAIDVSSVAGMIAVWHFHRADSAGPAAVGRLQPDPAVATPAAQVVHVSQLAGLHRPRHRAHPPADLLAGTKVRFRLFDIFVPFWSPVQPFTNNLGALGFYLVSFVVITSYFRHLFGHHNWKLLHYTAYAAAFVFYIHGARRTRCSKTGRLTGLMPRRSTWRGARCWCWRRRLARRVGSRRSRLAKAA